MPETTIVTILPEGVREGNEHLVCLTADAGLKVAALIAREKQGDFLRIAITGGGCNGLSYKLRFVAEARKGDILVRTAGVPVLVDPKTALYLKGTQLDYSHKMVAGGFKFFQPECEGQLLLRREFQRLNRSISL